MIQYNLSKLETTDSVNFIHDYFRIQEMKEFTRKFHGIKMLDWNEQRIRL